MKKLWGITLSIGQKMYSLLLLEYQLVNTFANFDADHKSIYTMEKSNTASKRFNLLEYESFKVFNAGKYRIEYHLVRDVDDKTDNVFEDIGFVESLNGAKVHHNKYLTYKINWKDEPTQSSEGKVLSVDYTMTDDDPKLSKIFETSPYGLIKKNRTGIGATTLELKSPRNSIIVVPTKALAYTKARVGKTGGKYKYLYVGSSISGSNMPTIYTYLNDTSIEYKKFLVVADSLPRLLKEIGESSYKDYFLMVDEIDSYQYDSNYRPALEDVIDYYFKFPETQRCLVSATVGVFSNPKINEEPVINIKFNNPQPRKIDLIWSNNVVETTRKKIESIHEKYPDEKILIAYNSIRHGILPVINMLNEQLKTECAVLCSVKSQGYVDKYYTDIEGNILPQKITFMTCTYFVGIDIDERFHLISVADLRHPYTLLSEEKLQQIAGRCRHKDGLLSETIIYSSDTLFSFEKPKSTVPVDKIVDDANMLADFANAIPKIQSIYPKVIPNNKVFAIDEIVENSERGYKGTEQMRMVRKSADGYIVPAYFNIDNLVIQQNLKRGLYQSTTALKDALVSSGNIVAYEAIYDEPKLPEEIKETIMEGIAKTEEEELGEIINELRKMKATQAREDAAIQFSRLCSRKNEQFLLHFIELQKYVPFEQLVDKLSTLNSSKDYRQFYNSVMIWALSENHPLKYAIKNSFPLNSKLTGKEIERGVSAIWDGLLNMGELKHNQYYDILALFCKKSDRTSKRVNGKTKSCYIIESYDVNDFGCEPLEFILADAKVQDLLRF